MNMIKNYTAHKVITITVLLFLAGCGEHKKIAKDLADYNERLQSFTGIKLAPTPKIDNLYAPNKQSLKLDVEQLSINLREFNAFNQCSLNQLVAQRNTALGKMQLPSSRFAYESKLIFELMVCQQNLKDDDEKADLQEKLAIWTIQKQQQFPRVWANLITQSSETVAHLTGGSGFISGTSSDNFQATKQALTFILKGQSGHPIDASALERHLQQLGNAPLLAKQWRTQILLKQELDSISSLLRTYLEGNTCSGIKQQKSIEIMQNIFRLFFAQRIQPVAGQLSRYHYQLSGLVEQLAQSSQIPPEFANYLSLHNKLNYAAYTEAMRLHIEIWQQIFTRCEQSTT
jgi:hypothetical protein